MRGERPLSDVRDHASRGGTRPSRAAPAASPPPRAGSRQGGHAGAEPAATSTSADLLRLFSRHRLTPAQRRIAQCLTEQGTAAAFLSSTEVAGLAGVSQPSITRFAVALGFSGYPALRRQLRSLDSSPDPNRGTRPRQGALQEAIGTEIGNLEVLRDQLADDAVVREAARALMGSRPIVVLGLRAACGLAVYFAYFAAKIHPDVRLITDGGSLVEDRLEQARAAGGRCVLSFALPRYPRDAVAALTVARALGFQTITVCDHALTPFTALSDLLLVAAVGTRLVFDSQVAPMALSAALLQAMCASSPKQTQRRLESFESAAIARKLFVS